MKAVATKRTTSVELHETITCNHQCRGVANLLARVKHFMDTVSPFPGCRGQLNPDTWLGRVSAVAGGIPSLC
ncbi:hypothetical protein CF140_20270 [Aeromonas sobria]|nr:hypothetical protein CF140_20270 [Aeromonas sobria]